MSRYFSKEWWYIWLVAVVDALPNYETSIYASFFPFRNQYRLVGALSARFLSFPFPGLTCSQFFVPVIVIRRWWTLSVWRLWKSSDECSGRDGFGGPGELCFLEARRGRLHGPVARLLRRRVWRGQVHKRALPQRAVFGQHRRRHRRVGKEDICLRRQSPKGSSSSMSQLMFRVGSTCMVELGAQAR